MLTLISRLLINDGGDIDDGEFMMMRENNCIPKIMTMMMTMMMLVMMIITSYQM